MASENIKIDMPKTNNPFKLSQYILKLIDVIRKLKQNIKDLAKVNENLKAENEELKKNWFKPIIGCSPLWGKTAIHKTGHKKKKNASGEKIRSQGNRSQAS